MSVLGLSAIGEDAPAERTAAGFDEAGANALFMAMYSACDGVGANKRPLPSEFPQGEIDYWAAHYCDQGDHALRTMMERAVIRRALVDLVAAGCSFNVDDGEDGFFLDSRTDDIDLVMGELMQMDEDHIYVYGPKSSFTGTMYLVYGNDGYDVICDNTTNLEPMLAGATMLGDVFCERMGA